MLNNARLEAFGSTVTSWKQYSASCNMRYYSTTVILSRSHDCSTTLAAWKWLRANFQRSGVSRPWRSRLCWRNKVTRTKVEKSILVHSQTYAVQHNFMHRGIVNSHLKAYFGSLDWFNNLRRKKLISAHAFCFFRWCECKDNKEHEKRRRRIFRYKETISKWTHLQSKKTAVSPYASMKSHILFLNYTHSFLILCDKFESYNCKSTFVNNNNNNKKKENQLQLHLTFYETK